VHYGLKPLKTRPAAKNALLVSFKANDRTLTVPEGIVKLESDFGSSIRGKERGGQEEAPCAKEARERGGRAKAQEAEEGRRRVDGGISRDHVQEGEAKPGMLSTFSITKTSADTAG